MHMDGIAYHGATSNRSYQRPATGKKYDHACRTHTAGPLPPPRPSVRLPARLACERRIVMRAVAVPFAKRSMSGLIAGIAIYSEVPPPS